MPCELRVQRLGMEDDHFSFGGADGQAHAEAELMHTINQVLQSMRCPGKEYDVVGIHQCGDRPDLSCTPTAGAQLQASKKSCSPSKKMPNNVGLSGQPCRTPMCCTAGQPAVPSIFIANVPVAYSLSGTGQPPACGG